MAHIRKTRQQKIQLSQRKPKLATPVQDTSLLEANTSNNLSLSGHEREIAETQQYVLVELKRIGWISALCAAILVVATILLSNFSWAQEIRSWLSI